MVSSTTGKRRRTAFDSTNHASTPAKNKTASGRRGRPPNAPRDGRERPPSMAECFKKRCNDVLDRLSKKDHHDIFLEPVNTNDVVGYLDVIKDPMDFTTMRTKLANQEYKSLGEFRKDLDLIWSNCLLFNGKEPTNVYSKKAIELRRLTEKLIVSTRQHLEKDKEAVQKWKEKHRKRRETMAANASNASVIHGANMGIPSPSASNQEGRPLPDPGISHDHMDGITSLDADDGNGRSPEENALADAMRLQYSGATGLYKKNMTSTPLPHYTKPDGSIVPIPITRYNPEQERWATKDPLSRPVLNYNLNLTLYSDSLPPSRSTNPSHPRPYMDSFQFSNYANSLYSYVKGSGKIPVDIVTELLSPELAIKAEQEALKQRGLTPAEISRRPNPIASGLHPPPKPKPYKRKRRWDVSDIVALASDIDKVNKRTVSVFPTPVRSLNELDGLATLVNVMGKDLCDEVEQVPEEVIDTAMPCGASLRTLTEILRLRASPGIRDQQNDLREIEQLLAQTQDYITRKGAALASKMRNSSLMSPSQLHDIQMRDVRERKKRRLEAERQAAYISRYSVLDGDERKETIRPQYGNIASAGVKQNVTFAPTSTQMGTVPMRQKDVNPSITASESQMRHQLLPPPNSSTMQIRNTGFLQGVPQATQNNISVSSIPTSEKQLVCSNCGTSETPSWHAIKVGPHVERFCLQCGVYWQKFGQLRPKEPVVQAPSNSIQRQVPLQTSNTVVSLPAPFDSQVNNPHDLLNGINRQTLRRPSRSPPRSARRSPTTSHHSSGINEPSLRGEHPINSNQQAPRMLDQLPEQSIAVNNTGQLMDPHARFMNPAVPAQTGKPTTTDVLFNNSRRETDKPSNLQDPSGFTTANMNSFANQQRSETTTIPSQPNSSSMNSAFINYGRGKPNTIEQNIMPSTEDLAARNYNSMYKDPSALGNNGAPAMTGNDMKETLPLAGQLAVNNQQTQPPSKNTQKTMNTDIGFISNQNSAALPVGNSQLSLAPFSNNEPPSLGAGADIGNSGLSGGGLMNEALESDGIGENVGNAEMSNNGVGNNGLPSSGILGFDESRGIFGNGASDEAGNSDQLVDNILFEEGGIASAAPGTGEFDF